MTRQWRTRRALAPIFSLIVLLAVSLSAPLACGNTAPDGPGALSHFDLARKDCVGTAQNTTSKVWFTIANGVLSDVYFPTNDNTNVETLQYVVTDGSTFTDIQTRDTTYTAQSPDARSLDCRITATAKNGKYRITTDYLTDTSHNTVVIHTHFQPLAGSLSSYKLYVIYNPPSMAMAAEELETGAPILERWTRPLVITFWSPPIPARRLMQPTEPMPCRFTAPWPLLRHSCR